MPIEVFLREAIEGGVGMVQLREKKLSDAELLVLAQRCARACRNLGIPFIMNDRVDIALYCGANGVHVGQEDLAPHVVRELVGKNCIVGLSTHSAEQIEQATVLPVDYIGVGPVHQTPTKAGRPAVGLELVRYAAEHARQPFFAIGGLDPSNVAAVTEAGARGVSVLRWIAQASDPNAAARQLLECMEEPRRGLVS